MNFKIIKNYAMVALATMALVSCSNDDFMDDTPSLKAEGMATAPQGILPGVQSANGPWITSSITSVIAGYYKSHGNNLPGTFNLAEGNFKTDYSPGGRAFNGSYYTLNNTSTGKRGIRKLNASGSNLFDVGTIVTSDGGIRGQKDEVNFTLFDATHGYYTDGEAGGSYGKIGTFNPSNMQEGTPLDVGAKVEDRLKIDVFGNNQNRLQNEYKNLLYKKIGTKLLIRRGNYLYADVTFGNSRNRLNQIRQSTKKVYVAVINVASSTPVVERILIGNDAENIGLFNDHPLVCIDPISKDIYFATVGDMDKSYGVTSGEAGLYSKIFKIDGANNMTKVACYQDVANTTAFTHNNHLGEIQGGKKKEGQFNTLYVYSGKIYTKIADRSVVYGDINFHGQTYRNNIWQYVVMEGNSTPQKINIPKDNFYAYQQPQLINGKLYMISNSNQGANVYRVNLGGGNPTVVTTGVVGGLGWGWLYPNKVGSIVKL